MTQMLDCSSPLPSCSHLFFMKFRNFSNFNAQKLSFLKEIILVYSEQLLKLILVTGRKISWRCFHVSLPNTFNVSERFLHLLLNKRVFYPFLVCWENFNSVCFVFVAYEILSHYFDNSSGYQFSFCYFNTFLKTKLKSYVQNLICM